MERSWASSGKRASNSASSARRMSSTVEARTRSWSPRSRAGGFRRFCCIRGQRARSRGISMKKMSFVFPVAAALLFAGTLAGQSTVPEIPYDSAPNPLKLPEHVYLGEAAGVATNSKGNLFVYTRSGGTLASVGASRTFTHAGARLFEFAANGKFVREIGTGVYGFLPNPLKLPEHVYLGEAAGVATNSKGNLFVYTRSGGTLASVGASRTFTHAGARRS